MGELKQKLDMTARDTDDELRLELSESIFDRFGSAVYNTVGPAIETTELGEAY